MKLYPHWASAPAAMALALACVLCSLNAHAQAAVSAPPAGTPPSTAPAGEYRLGPGDSIHVAVYQNPDLTLDTRLTDSGTVSFPLLGSLPLGGLTVGEAEHRIALGLKAGEFVKNPQVSVVLVQTRGSQVSVLGHVNRAGRYPLEQGGMRVSDVLALAGGPIPNFGGDLVTVIGTRNGQAFRQQVNIQNVFSAADRKSDLVLQANDAIYVERAPQVYIYGEVQHPGQIRLERGMTLLQSLAAGGGLTLRGTEKGIRVHRPGADGKTEVLQPGMEEALKDGDVVYVRESLF